MVSCTTQSIGECPECGDEIYIFRTASRKRYAKCVNEECPKEYSFPLPSKGKIEVTGILCQKYSVFLLAIIPNLRLSKGRYVRQEKKTYFWTSAPCFTCREQSHCSQLNEAQEDYE